MSEIDGLQFSQIIESFHHLYLVVADVENGEIEEIIESFYLLDGVIVEG